MRVSDILRQKGGEVATVRRDHSIAEAAQVLAVRKIGALVVADDGSTIDGIISERDVVRHLAERGADALLSRVDEVMTADVITCQRTDAVDQLMSVMTERRVRHLPVIDADGKLDGLVSIGDVVKRRVGQLVEEARHLQDYLQTGR